MLEATISAPGAELSSLRHEQFGEVIWQAGPVWPSHAPNLFPIIGQLAGDVLHAGGRSYPMGRHGFARRRRFTWIDTSAAACLLELRDDEQTREHYPFAFRLRIGFALADETLTVTYTIANPGEAPLPASVGAHPAFIWPLVPGIPKTEHTLQFAQAEPAPIRRLANGLLMSEKFPSPVVGRTLHLDDSLFVADAIVMDRVASSAVTYGAPGAPAITVGWDGFRELGIWSKDGGEFICIEPWRGYASPVDFDGPFADKPGLMHIPPAGQETLVMRISIASPG
jgi:galactose mutarotase-like enzyme